MKFERIAQNKFISLLKRRLALEIDIGNNRGAQDTQPRNNMPNALHKAPWEVS